MVPNFNINIFYMYQAAFEKIKKSIFPIFFEKKEIGRIDIGVLGTGFFINSTGYFITANHVISNLPVGSNPVYFGNIPISILPQPLLIKEVFKDSKRDIFLGKIEVEKSIPVDLNFEKQSIGKSLCLCGYPLAHLFFTSEGLLNLGNVRQYWQPSFLIDNFTGEVDNKFYQGFITQHTSLNGMSGGPVFDIEGVVYGIDVAMITRTIKVQNQPDLIVQNGVVIDNVYVKDIFDKIIK